MAIERCPACQMSVLRRGDGTCPSCGHDGVSAVSAVSAVELDGEQLAEMLADRAMLALVGPLAAILLIEVPRVLFAATVLAEVEEYKQMAALGLMLGLLLLAWLVLTVTLGTLALGGSLAAWFDGLSLARAGGATPRCVAALALAPLTMIALVVVLWPGWQLAWMLLGSK